MKHDKETMLFELRTGQRASVVMFSDHYNEFVRLSRGRIERLP